MSSAIPKLVLEFPDVDQETRTKRVAIARDVLKRLILGSVAYKARSCYLKRRDSGFYSDHRARESELNAIATIMDQDDLRRDVDIVESRCVVCLLGGMMLSKARVLNHVPVQRVLKDAWTDESGDSPSASSYYLRSDFEDVADSLSDVFDPVSIAALETAFENSVQRQSRRDATMFLINRSGIEDAKENGSLLTEYSVDVKNFLSHFVGFAIRASDEWYRVRSYRNRDRNIAWAPPGMSTAAATAMMMNIINNNGMISRDDNPQPYLLSELYNELCDELRAEGYLGAPGQAKVVTNLPEIV